jgi:uracil-DNA glycosylase
MKLSAQPAQSIHAVKSIPSTALQPEQALKPLDTLNAIIDDLVGHITVLRELGQRHVRVDPELVTELGRKRAPGPPAAALRAAPAASRAAPQPQEPARARERLTEALLRNTAPLPPPQRAEEMRRLQREINHCFNCGLCKNRTAALAGEGRIDTPDVMFIGAAPSAHDQQAESALSGPEGELLTKMIASIGYRREDVYLVNLCKCPTPRNRAPSVDEMAACSLFLEEQIMIVRPRVIVALGEHAGRGLFHTIPAFARPHGTWTKYHGIPVMPIHHPRYILRFSDDTEGHQRELKRSAWKALKAVRQLLGSPSQAGSN